MRKIQLSFKIDNFAEMAPNGEHQVIKGYIDGNNIYEVLKEEIEALRGVYAKEISFAEFCQQIENFDGARFGATEVEAEDVKP